MRYFILSLCLLLSTIGCASLLSTGVHPSEFVARFPYPASTVWVIVVNSLKDLPIEKAVAEKRSLETEWMEGLSTRLIGAIEHNLKGSQWLQRIKVKLEVTVLDENHSEVKLTSWVEERPRESAQALVWQRVPSDRKMEEELFRRIQEGLDGLLG
jgi:hypothetical protein